MACKIHSVRQIPYHLLFERTPFIQEDWITQDALDNLSSRSDNAVDCLSFARLSDTHTLSL